MNVYETSEVEHRLEAIANEEKEANDNLIHLLSKQCQIESKMSIIGHVMKTLTTIIGDSQSLLAQTSNAAQLAEAVSAKVRRVDIARSCASECQQRVHDLIDLQLCSQGVVRSLADNDFETCANHVGRFLAMDQQILQRTADDVQGAVTSVSDAVQTLQTATEKMRDLVQQKFDQAVAKDDLPTVERFFKIFPLLGCHEFGIQKFSQYICGKLALKADKEIGQCLNVAKAEDRLAVAFADTLTIILENFARVVEVNQPVLEGCYGAGYLVDMLAILQKECDSQMKRLIVDFNRHRQLPRRIALIKESQRGANSSSGGGSSGLPVMGHYRKPSEGTEKMNPKDIDAIIAEITAMHSRVELYFRFMRRKVTADLEASGMDEEQLEAKTKQMEDILKTSGLSYKMQELLDAYLLFERYFIEESVVRAISLDTHETGQLYSSMADDVFFVVRKSIRRSLTTHSINGTCAVINIVASSLDKDFVSALRAAFKSGYPLGYIDLAQAYNAIQSTLQQGKLQSSDTEMARNKFLVQLNNADLSTEYIETLWQTMNQEIQSSFPALSRIEKEILNNCIVELQNVRDSLKACIDSGVQQLHSSAIKPRLNSWVDEFLNHNHLLTDEELADYEAGETYAQFLIVNIDQLLSSFRQSLSQRNYDALVSLLAAEVTSRLERAIKKCTFNRLGGLVLDQEVRSLGTYLTGATSWSVRDKMTRLMQITTLLNLEKLSELLDYWHPEKGSNAPSWRLTPNEVRTVLALRTDFRLEEIKRFNFSY